MIRIKQYVYIFTCFAIVGACYLIAFNQADLITARHTQDAAVVQCMQYRISKAVIVDGETYCMISVMQPGATGEVVFVFDRAMSLAEMQKTFGFLEPEK